MYVCIRAHTYIDTHAYIYIYNGTSYNRHFLDLALLLNRRVFVRSRTDAHVNFLLTELPGPSTSRLRQLAARSRSRLANQLPEIGGGDSDENRSAATTKPRSTQLVRTQPSEKREKWREDFGTSVCARIYVRLRADDDTDEQFFTWENSCPPPGRLTCFLFFLHARKQLIYFGQSQLQQLCVILSSN